MEGTLIPSSSKNGILTGIRDVDRLILLQLDDVQLKAVYESNKYAYTIVCNETFWIQKVVQKYGVVVANEKPEKMIYIQQYYNLPTFISKSGNIIKAKLLEATKQGRLDAFIVYRYLWAKWDIFDRFKIFSILINKGYINIVKAVVLTYNISPFVISGEWAENDPSALLHAIEKLSSRGDVEILDIIYREYFEGTTNTFPVEDLLVGNPTNSVLKWAIDNDIINNSTLTICSRFNGRQQNELRIIKCLAEYNIFPTTDYIHKSIRLYRPHYHTIICPVTLQFLISKGVFNPTVETANDAAQFGNLDILNFLEEQGILPNSIGANYVLTFVYYRDICSVLKWMYNRGISPTDKELIHENLYSPYIFTIGRHREGWSTYISNTQKWLQSTYKDLLSD